MSDTEKSVSVLTAELEEARAEIAALKRTVKDHEDTLDHGGNKIPELMQTERALELERRKLAAAFDSPAVGFVICDGRGGDIMMNNAALKMHEFASQEEVRRSVGAKNDDWELRSLDNRPMLHEDWPLVRALRGEFVRDFVFRYHNRKTLTRWICNLTVAPVRSRDGEVDWIVQSLTDVTAAYERAEELRDLTQRLHLATSSARAAVWDWNLQTNEMVWDDRMLELYGLDGETFPGGIEAWERGLHPEDRSRAIEECQAALRGEREFDTDFRVRRPDGAVAHVKANGLVLRDEAGKPLRMIGLNTDITDRRRADDALRMSEERHRRLVEAIPGILYTYSDELGGSYYSPQVETILGYTAEHLLKHPRLWRDSVHADDQAAVDRAVVADSPAGSEVEYRIRDARGNWLWFLDRFVRFRREKGATTIEGLVVDITARKRAEDERRTLSRAVEQSPTSIVITDRTGNIEYVNPRFEQVTGYTRAEALGNNLRILKSNTTPAETYIDLWKVISQGGEWRGELCNRRKNGELFWEFAAISGLKDQHGEVAHYVAVKEDISDRKIAAEALARSHDLLVNLARLVPGVIYQYRLYPDGRSAFPYSSPGMNDIYEVTPEEVREDATPVFGRLHPEDYDHVANAIQESARTLATFYCEFRVVLPRQGLRWRWSQAHPERTSDGGTLWHGIISDITEQKGAEQARLKLEDQLQQAQKMESVGRLAGGIAHDFNNMLSVILGHTEMALEDVDPALSLHEDLLEIRNAASRSADLTRQLLAFARKQTIAPKVLDLSETVAGMLKMLQRLLGENVRVAWLAGGEVWPIRIDPSQVDQILANLCVNARDAISDVGKLTIETGNVTFDADYCAANVGSVPGDYVRLVVSDDGCGMNKETLAQVFEPFFTTKEMGKGTGLGLATVYGIVKQNGGFINVYSEPGKGSTFTVYLPRYGAKLDAERASVALPAVRGHETILLVEDEPAILRATKRMLERLGYKVLAAITPGEAMRLARESGDLHLLMTDVVMPEMNGRDLAKNLLALYPGLKRLFMSGFTADVIAHQGVLEDGVNFIQKPFSKEALATKVRAVLDGEPSN